MYVIIKITISDKWHVNLAMLVLVCETLGFCPDVVHIQKAKEREGQVDGKVI